jgi:hypothetical protein
MEQSYEVVWPSSRRGIQPHRAATRLETLEGKRIGFLWDYLFRGDELFPILEKELTNEFPGLEVIGYDEFGNTHGGNEAETIEGLPTALAQRQIDAVVSGMGC